MYHRSLTVFCGLMAGVLVGCPGESSKLDGDSSKPSEKTWPKSGEIAQLAFSSDGQNLAVVNEYRPYGNRRKEHSRARRFATSDWKSTADTGELSISGLYVATSATGPWLVQGMWFEREGEDNIPPYTDKGAAFLTLDSVTLKMKEIDVVRRRKGQQGFPCGRSRA